jgi:hypothetical protein
VDDLERFERVEKRAGLVAVLVTLLGIGLACAGHALIGVGVIFLAGICFIAVIGRASRSLSSGGEGER